MTVSVPQITAQLEAVLAREPSALAIAIKSATKQVWPDEIPHRGRRFALRWCDSLLGMREALTDAEQADTALAGLVLLTPLNTNEIPEDIAARLARGGRVFQPEGWEIVRQLFGAKGIDARLGRYSWMPQVLVDGSAQGTYTPVANGFLDLETAWKELLQRFLQLDTSRPDATALLKWTMQPGSDASINLLPANARPDALNWLSESGGIAGKMVLACIEAGRTGDAMALGLVCGVLYAPAGEGQAALGNAAIRLERFVNDAHVGVTEGREWAQAAQQMVREGGSDLFRSAMDRADHLLSELRVGEFAHLSDVLPMGFDQRMRTFAAMLTLHAKTPTEKTLAAVEASADHALTHVLATTQIQRADRVEMARRMARWMVRPVTAASTVADLACWQADEGSFVDWARFRLLGGDELVEVSKAYESVRNAAITRRNVLGQRFAQALQRWNSQAPGPEGRIVPLESVFDHVVAPLAALQPVLLLVIDGLSTSIFRELFARPERLGWGEMVPAALARPLAGVAAFPTVTEVSRATLLCGRLTTGTSSLEKTGFSSHAGLMAQSRTDTPPKLFHKGELSDSTNLSSEVRSAIANPHQRIVGLVYNAVDDHLSGPDQLNQRWALEDLRLILPILNEAKAARRVVIVTADHGHLLEDGTTQISGGESDRWRNGNDAVNSNEIVLTKGRVRTATGATSVACLWSESIRYAGRKNGYHGGASLQEVAVPLSVLVPFGINLPEWQPALPAQPEWWDLPNLAVPKATPITANVAPRSTARKAAPPLPGQDQLFDTAVPAAEVAAPIDPDNWIETLLQSQVYASQRTLAARVAPPDEQMRKLLSALTERGGKLSRAALAQRISVPEIRLTGMLSAARRVLNVDQAAVLLVDEAVGTVELNRILLLQQFRINLTGRAR